MASVGNLNVMMSTFALSNVVDDIREDAAWASNSAVNIMQKLHWTAHKAVWASNALRTMGHASNSHASNSHASNTNSHASNPVPRAAHMHSVDSQAGADGTFASNNLKKYALLSRLTPENWNFGSNAAAYASNALAGFAPVESASNWDFASNVASFTSNAMAIAENGFSNWNYASNSIASAIDAISNMSNSAALNYARVSGVSNWNWASNSIASLSNSYFKGISSSPTARGAISTPTILDADVLAAVYGSNTSTWASNNTSYILTILMSAANNWDWASNTASSTAGASITASAVAQWASNANANTSDHIAAVATGASNTSNVAHAAHLSSAWASNHIAAVVEQQAMDIASLNRDKSILESRMTLMEQILNAIARGLPR